MNENVLVKNDFFFNKKDRKISFYGSNLFFLVIWTEIGVECLIFVIVIFLNWGHVLRFGAH